MPRIDAVPAPSSSNDLETERPDSLSAYSQETVADGAGSLGRDIDPAVDRAHRGSRGSISLVPVEEALLAQKLLRRLNRRAEDRSSVPMSGKKKHGVGEKLPTGVRLDGGKRENSERNTGAMTGKSSDASGGGRSFLLGMSGGKFLGYGRR